MNIELKNATKIYDEKPILKSLNLNIKNIKSLGLIGESGCGKSTLLRQLSGIELLDFGEVRVNDTIINQENLREYQKNIGYVFQQHNLFPHLTVKDNLMLILNKIKKIDIYKSSKICSEILKKFHLTEIEDKLPSKISGGQGQRVSIARAIASKPDLIFLDEPTAALDPILTKEVLNSVKILSQGGSDFIFVTHEIDFLSQFADYFIFMDRGQIIEHGKIQNLINPNTKKLREFIRR